MLVVKKFKQIKALLLKDNLHSTTQNCHKYRNCYDWGTKRKGGGVQTRMKEQNSTGMTQRVLPKVKGHSIQYNYY